MKKAVILTYGCQMNKHDSEVIGGILEQAGYSIIDELTSEVDLILMNTCAVRENAVQRIKGRLGELKKYKDKNKNLIIGIAGCVAQNEGRKLLDIEHLDFVVGPQNILQINTIINTVEQGNRVCLTDNKFADLNSGLPHKRKNNFQGYVSIISGCNNFCTYCIVPYVRQRERSRNIDDILNEIKSLLDKGIKEITLLGQNVNSYGNDLNNNVSFTMLLKEIIKFKHDFWIRFVTSHPKDLSGELIEIMSSSEKICNQLHLPVQSGSDKILELMERGYNIKSYIGLIEKLRKKIPDISLTTDVITGFPGETETDFNQTYELLKHVKFDSTFIFKYSDRKKTKAYDFSDKISEKIIKIRHKKLLDLQKNLSAVINQKYIGQNQKILVNCLSPKDNKYLTARNQYNKVVIIKGSENLIGSFCETKIKDVKSWTLYGKPVS